MRYLLWSSLREFSPRASSLSRPSSTASAGSRILQSHRNPSCSPHLPFPTLTLLLSACDFQLPRFGSLMKHTPSGFLRSRPALSTGWIFWASTKVNLSCRWSSPRQSHCFWRQCSFGRVVSQSQTFCRHLHDGRVCFQRKREHFRDGYRCWLGIPRTRRASLPWGPQLFLRFLKSLKGNG